jgi:Nucleotidyl transferase AbiEii toxin, Type IV TA system
MSAVFTAHLDILPAAQRQVWPALGVATALGFVLYGGTAIALRLGHRPSVDFDFFTERPLDKDALRIQLPFIAGATVLQDQPNTLTILVPVNVSANTSANPSTSAQQGEEVKVSYFGGLGFGRIGHPEQAIPGNMQVASLNDLLAHKLKVVLQRIEAKDYLDIAALIAAGVELDIGIAGAQTLFGPSFQPSECLKALVYFEGGDLESLSDQTRTTLIEAVRTVGDLPPVPRLSDTLVDDTP